MSEQDRLREYREYYRARAARYAANPLYPATAAAEARLLEAVEAATSIADLQQLAELSLACGKALARDEAAARAALYARTADDVRAQAPAEVLASVESVADAAGLAALTGGAEQRASQAVAADELTRLWSAALTTLENVATWRGARVPERWRGELEGYAADALRAEQGVWAGVVAQAPPGWRFADAVAHATRHRRLVPMPDAPFEGQLAAHRSLVRGEQG